MCSERNEWQPETKAPDDLHMTQMICSGQAWNSMVKVREEGDVVTVEVCRGYYKFLVPWKKQNIATN